MQLGFFKNIAVTLGLSLIANTCLAANPRQCEVELEIKDKAYFVGTWVLESTKPTMINGIKPTHEIWQFGAEGSFKLTAKDPRASDVITSESTFAVEKNTLKIARVGRVGKFYSYKVCAKDNTKLILFGGLEGFHFFSKK